MIPQDALVTLREVNGHLRSALVRFRPEQSQCSTIRPQDFSDLRGQLLRAAECLRHLPFPLEILEKEFFEYRGNLEKLKHSLPDVHARLLAEKSRLESARNHLAAAATWAKTRENIL